MSQINTQSSFCSKTRGAFSLCYFTKCHGTCRNNYIAINFYISN